MIYPPESGMTSGAGFDVSDPHSPQLKRKMINFMSENFVNSE